MDYHGDNLTGEIAVDGNRYAKCNFKDVTLVFSGGEPPSLIDCNFSGSLFFLFKGSAGRTMEFLIAMHQGGFSHITGPMLQKILAGSPPPETGIP